MSAIQDQQESSVIPYQLSGKWPSLMTLVSSLTQPLAPRKTPPGRNQRHFAPLILNEPLPDHSSLTRIRNRYGVEVFRRFFSNHVAAENSPTD